MNLFTVIK